MSSIILLEPFRSALTADAIKEGIIRVPEGIDIAASPSLQVGMDSKLRSNVRQLFLFFDSVSIIQHEDINSAPDLKKKGYDALSLIRLKDLGIIDFTNPPADRDRVEKIKNMRSLEEWWQIDIELLDQLEPLIISQMHARGKLPHPSIYYLLRAIRTQSNNEIEDRFKQIPKVHKEFAQAVVQDRFGLPYDFVVFSTLNEIIDAESVTSPDTRVAMEGGEYTKDDSSNTVKKAAVVYEIMLNTLLGDGFQFPVPESLKDIERYKKDERLKSFRELFNPWLTSLQTGNEEDERRLRKEVRKSALQFKHSRKLEISSELTSWVAIPIGFIPVIGSLVGSGLSIASKGMEKMAKRWKEKSQWVGVCTKIKNS